MGRENHDGTHEGCRSKQLDQLHTGELIPNNSLRIFKCQIAQSTGLVMKYIKKGLRLGTSGAADGICPLTVAGCR
jgi:hypothetical protein